MPSSLVLSDSVLDFEAKRKLKKDKKKMMKNNNDDSIMETEKKKKESKKKKRLVEEVIEDENLIVSSKKPKKQKISEITEDAVVKKKSKKNDPNAVSNFKISEPLKEKLRSKGIETLFPIQAMTFNTVLDGFDLVGRAHTGQGKTLAFVLPILESLTNGLAKTSRKTGYGRAPTVLVLLPTRELAIQVHAVFEVYGGAVGINATCLYGQTPYPQQETALRRGVDVVIGTPGRIKDFVLKRTLDLSSLKFRVLDEADEMLRLGFVADVELILGQVKDLKQVQTLLFSATLPSCVQNIARRFLKPEKETADLVGNEKMKASANVRHMVLPCCSNARSQLIPDIIRCYSSGGRTIIFTETKNSASELAGLLPDARALHGDIQQATREVTLKGFRSGKFMTLVATNVAARGLDINDVQLVIQCEPPRDVEDYIHRSGRTGRAGNTGVAVMLYESRMRSSVSRIEKESGFKFEHVSAPQPADVAKVVGFDAAEAITKVTDSVIPIFESVAEFLLSSSGLSAKHLLSKALAKAAGYTEIKTRSLLTSMENYVTVHLEAGKRVYSPSFIFGILKRLLPEEKVELVKGVTLTADARGAVFDVPSGDLDSFLTGQKNAANVSIDVVTVLPPLQERVESRMGRYGGVGGRYGGRFGGYGGRGAPKW